MPWQELRLFLDHSVWNLSTSKTCSHLSYPPPHPLLPNFSRFTPQPLKDRMNKKKKRTGNLLNTQQPALQWNDGKLEKPLVSTENRSNTYILWNGRQLWCAETGILKLIPGSCFSFSSVNSFLSAAFIFNVQFLPTEIATSPYANRKCHWYWNVSSWKDNKSCYQDVFHLSTVNGFEATLKHSKTGIIDQILILLTFLDSTHSWNHTYRKGKKRLPEVFLTWPTPAAGNKKC